MAVVVSAGAGCAIGVAQGDKDEPARYGATGLPANCRALVQAAISGFRGGQHSAEDTIASLDRNCGPAGYLWRR